jgi:hypothetical protein
MPKLLSRMFSRGRSTAAADPVAPVEAADPVAPVAEQGNPRVGLWVLAAFTTIAALVAISVVVIGPQNADLMVFIPMALFWSVAVCVGFAVRAALMNVVTSVSRRVRGLPAAEAEQAPAPVARGGFLSRHREEQPDATLERLARMVRTERNREALHPQLARALVHAAV